MNTGIRTAALCLTSMAFFQLSHAAEPPFSAYFDTSNPAISSDNKITFDGVRVDGFGLSASNDALKLEYLFDHASLNLIFQQTFKLYPNVGVFRDQYMVVEPSPVQPSWTVGGTGHQAGTEYNFSATATAPFVAALPLKIGHFMNFYMKNASTRYKTTFNGSGADVSWLNEPGSVCGGYGITRSDGMYTLKLEPADPSKTLTFSIILWNANNRSITPISNGSYITASFRSCTYEYAKYTLELNTGDILTVPGGNDFEVTLLDSIGRKVTSTPDATLVHQVAKTGRYYLFISDVSQLSGRTYSGRISITAGKARSGAREAIIDSATVQILGPGL